MTKTGSSALHACAHRPSGIAKTLLSARANVHALDGFRRSPLHEAAKHGHAENAELFARMGCDLIACDCMDMNPLQLAESKDKDAIRTAMLRGKKGVDEETPLDNLGGSKRHGDHRRRSSGADKEGGHRRASVAESSRKTRGNTMSLSASMTEEGDDGRGGWSVFSADGEALKKDEHERVVMDLKDLPPGDLVLERLITAGEGARHEHKHRKAAKLHKSRGGEQ